MIDVKLMFGYVDHIGDKIILEYYGGVGVRSRSMDRAFCIEDNTFSDTYTTKLFSIENLDLDPISAVISGGVKIGLAL